MHAVGNRMGNGYRLFLQLGDTVTHREHDEWGQGSVVQEMTSTITGGTCLVRIQFQDGRERTFNNDLDADVCCYYLGIRKIIDPDAAEPPRMVQPHRIGSR